MGSIKFTICSFFLNFVYQFPSFQQIIGVLLTYDINGL